MKLGRWTAIYVIVVVVFSVVAVRVITNRVRYNLERDAPRGGSTAFGANTSGEEVPSSEAVQGREQAAQDALSATKTITSEAAAATIETTEWEPDVTQRMHTAQRTLDTQLRRFEALQERVSQGYSALSGYRDGVDRLVLSDEGPGSRVIRLWGGQLSSQTGRLLVGIKDSIEDLRKLSAHEPYQQSRLTYRGTCDFRTPQNFDFARAPRNVQVVYEWFARYAKVMEEVDREWQSGLEPAYRAIEDMLAAELERARERREDIEQSSAGSKETPK